MITKVLRTIVLILATSVGMAQAPAIQWQKPLGGPDWERGQLIMQTTDGGYFVAGQTNSTHLGINNHGSDDVWIMKLNSIGTLQWQKCLGGSKDDECNAGQLTSDGGLILLGSSASNDGDVNGHHGGTVLYDFWIVKLDSNANIVWQKSIGGTDMEMAQSVRQTNDGGYIVAGYTFSNDGDVSGHHGTVGYGIGTEDYWVVKLDSNGNIQWQKSLGGTNSDQAYNIRETSDGGYIVVGGAGSNDGDANSNQGNFDFWVVKLNSSGTTQWQQSVGGTNSDIAYSVFQDLNGDYIIGGTCGSNDGSISGNHGNSDVWVIKLDNAGNLLSQYCWS